MKKIGSARAFAQRAVVVAVAVVASACGGGGGGGGSTPPGTIDITATNQDTLAQAAAVAMQGVMFDLGGVTGAGARSVARLRESRQGLVPLPPQSCSGGGTMSGTLDDTNGNGLPDTGETMTVVLTDCVENGEVANGTLALTPTRLDLSAFDAAVTATAFETRSSPDRRLRYDGGFSLSLREESATVATTRMTVSNSLRISVTHPLFDDTVTLASGFVTEARSDLSTALTTMSSRGRLESSDAVGTVTLNTLQAVEQADPDAWPRNGRIEVLGKTGSLTLGVELAPGGGTRVRAELDADGNGTPESSKTYEWSELL